MIPDRALVVGFGATGESTARFLEGRTELFVTDTRLDTSEDLVARRALIEAACPSAQFIRPSDVHRVVDEHVVVYASPGVPLHDPLLREVSSRGARISCDVELFLEQIDVPVLGVTGTNGKTTTTALLASMLEKQGYVAGGNIGTPVLDLLGQPASGYVLELSSFQLEKMRPPRLHGATILNISPDHLDHHGTMGAYREAKRRIYEACDVAVFNQFDCAARTSTAPRAIAINESSDWRIREDAIVIGGTDVPIDEFKLTGQHNLLNILSASALAHISGVAIDEIVESARKFTGLPHRMQLIAERDGVRYVNDSKATNIDATRVAIQSLSNRRRNIVLLAGGESKVKQFNALGHDIRVHVKVALLFGRDADQIAAVCGTSPQVIKVESLADAVERAHAMAEPGDVVLLSPACASFDMFEDYAARGNSFIAAVNTLTS